MSRLKALYRSWGISCSGKQVYTPRHREQWLNKITQPGVRRRAELMYQQMDGLSVVRHTVRGELLQLKIGLDASHNIGRLLWRGRRSFFLDIPSYRTH